MKNQKTLIFTLLLFLLGSFIALLTDRDVTQDHLTADPDLSLPPLPANPRRIICMTPSVTETVFALECGDRIIGVSDFCDYPAEAANLEKLGGFINPNLERLLALSPDLIIAQGKSERIIEFCQRENVPFLQVQMSNIESVFHDINQIATALGCPAQAQKLTHQIQDSLDKISSLTATLDRPRVFLSLYRTGGSLTGITTVGGNTFLSELIDIAGGANIFADLQKEYPQISKESLLKRQPDIVIEPYQHDTLNENQIQQRLAEWQELGAIPATQNNRIYFIHESTILKPGPRLAQIADYLARLIHPEAFK